MRVLITGASGQLGGYLIDQFHWSSKAVVAWSGSRTGMMGGVPLEPVDLTDIDRMITSFRAAAPSVVIHAAAMSSVADCFRDPRRAHAVNTQGSRLLAGMSVRAGARFVYVSTDLVFDGDRGGYREGDDPSALSVYGRTKSEAERAVLDYPGVIVARLSLMYGPTRVGRPSFFDQQLDALRSGRQMSLFDDEWRTPIDLVTAASALVSLATSEFTGIVHIGGPERMSRLAMGQRTARYLGLDPSVFSSAKRESAPFAEPRPRDCSLDCTRWRLMFPEHPWPDLEHALARMIPGLGEPAGTG